MSQACILSETWWKISKEEEYKNNKQLKPSDVTFIQEWLQKQPHLPPLNDNQIIMFIRACEYSLELAKETIDLNYTMRTKLPEFFAQRDLSTKTMQMTMEYFQVAVMPARHQDCIVTIFKLKPMEMSKYIFEEYMKLCVMVLDATHMQLGTSSGYIYIHDLKNFTFSHILQTPIPALANALKYLQDASTCNIKGIHFINGGTVFEKLLAVMKPFLNASVLEMIKLHPNKESLKKSLTAKVIPKDYSGEAPGLDELTEKTFENIKLYKEWYREEEKQRNDETKRMSDAIKDYGIQGTFRKLELD